MIDVIKPGYTLFLSSYLGDADYYNTNTITGLTKPQALLVERFVQRCISGYNFPDSSVYSRDSESLDMDRLLTHFSMGEVEMLLTAVWPGVVLDSHEPDQVEEAMRDLVFELLGHSDPHNGELPSFDGLKAAYFDNNKVLTNRV
jgi:hypothetical protein